MLFVNWGVMGLYIALHVLKMDALCFGVWQDTYRRARNSDGIIHHDGHVTS